MQLILYSARFVCVSFQVRVLLVLLLLWNLRVFEIPLDKELTAINFYVETHTKLKELIPAAMVDYGLVENSWLLLIF